MDQQKKKQNKTFQFNVKLMDVENYPMDPFRLDFGKSLQKHYHIRIFTKKKNNNI